MRNTALGYAVDFVLWSEGGVLGCGGGQFPYPGTIDSATDREAVANGPHPVSAVPG